MSAAREFTSEETINLLREKAAATTDNFRIKLWRFDHLSNQALQIATFADASVSHVTNPEMWVPQFAGGGRLAFNVYHATDINAPLGGYVKFQVEGEPRPLDLSAPFTAGWAGPKVLEYPKRPQAQAYNTVASPLNPAGTSPLTNVPGGGGGAPLFTLQQSNDPVVAKAVTDLQMKVEALNASRAALEEERHRLELQGIRQEQDMRLRELEAKTAQQIATLSQARPVEHASSSFKEIAAIFAPILQTVLQAQADTRNVMLKIDSERSARDSERAQRSETLMLEMMKRPAIDPTVLAILEKSREGSQPQAEMVAQMASAMGNVAEVTMHVVGQAAEMANGGQEHWGLTAAREIAKGMGALVTGMKPGVKAPGARPPGPPALPAQAQGFAGMPGTTPTGNGAVAAQNFQPPAPGVAGQGPQAHVQQPQPPGPSSIEQLIGAIRAYVPPHAVADAVMQSLHDPVFVAELDAADGSMPALATKYLGSDWLSLDPRNTPYAQALFAEIDARAKAAGLDQPDDGDDEDDEDESDQDSA